MPELPSYGHELLYFFRLVIEFPVDLRTADSAIIPQGLQCAGTYAQQAAHLLPVEPLLHLLVIASAT